MMANIPMEPRTMFQNILVSNGVQQITIDYLMAKGITTLNVLAYMAETQAQLEERLIEPFCAGVNINGTEHKYVDDKFVLIASLLASWESARSAVMAARDAHIAEANRLQQIQSQQIAGPIAQIQSAASASTKPPATLAQGVWAAQINKYETANHGRPFPVEILTGTEGILARMLHEHTVSKLYTPVRLGELLQNRCFTATGRVNTLATNKDDKALGLGVAIDGSIALTKAPVWDPRSQWQVVDGLTAARWAFIFCEIGEETTATKWTEFFMRHVRLAPAKLDRIKRFFDHASWRVCMDMRTGKSFRESTEAIMTDVVYISEQLTYHDYEEPSTRRRERSMTPEKPNKRQRTWKEARPIKGKGKGKQNKVIKGKGKGKGSKGKGKGKTQQKDGPRKQLCNMFNQNKCSDPECKYLHACWWCGKHHAGDDCWNQ